MCVANTPGILGNRNDDLDGQGSRWPGDADRHRFSGLRVGAVGSLCLTLSSTEASPAPSRRLIGLLADRSFRAWTSPGIARDSPTAQLWSRGCEQREILSLRSVAQRS